MASGWVKGYPEEVVTGPAVWEIRPLGSRVLPGCFCCGYTDTNGGRYIVTERKDATKATKEVNDRLLEDLPFDDRRDFEDAERGFIASLPDGGVIKGEDGGRGRAKTAL